MPNITTTPIEVEAEVKQYTLVGDDIYVKRYENDNIPDWYKNLINNILNNNSTITNITDAYNYLNSLQEGYNLAITHLQDGQLVIDTRLESLKSSNDVALAGIADLWITKVDGTSAQAIADFTVGAFFTGGNLTSGAWFNDRISTYSSAIQANASNISVLSATLGDTTVRIDTIDEVLVTLDGWSANASKLITAPDGSITGWSFGDGSNISSFFKIYASSFSISDGATGYTPFSIVGSNIYFTGKVNFSGITDAATYIPTITSVSTAQSTASTALATAQSKASIAEVVALGYVVPSGVANAINTNTTTINGSKITTGSIEALTLSATAISGQKLNISSATNPSATTGAQGCLGLFTSSANANFSALAGRNNYPAGHGVWGVNDYASSGAGVAGDGFYGGYFKGIGSHAIVGVIQSGTGYGLYTAADAYIGGTVYSFTGSHIMFSGSDVQVGDVVEVVDSWVVNMNQNATFVQRVSTNKSKKVIGVVTAISDDILRTMRDNELYGSIDANGVFIPKAEYAEFIQQMLDNNYKEVSVNSLGEGAVIVCSDNGNIEIGDYLVSTSTGSCMKQDDDLMHNYTVAKALENVDWSLEPSNTKMIGVTYHCG